MAPTEVLAADIGRRPGCRIEQQQTRQKQARGTQEQRQQQRARDEECREKRAIPPVVDPTPIFLL